MAFDLAVPTVGVLGSTGSVLWSMPRAPVRSRARAITCWPCSSASALRTDASGPGSTPATAADTVRRRSNRRISPFGPQPGQALAHQRVGGASGPPHRLDQVVGGGSHPPQGPGPGQGDPLVGQGDLGQGPPLAPADRPGCRAGRRTSSRKTSLKVWVPVMSTRGRTVHPRGVHRADEVGDAPGARGRRARSGPGGSRTGPRGRTTSTPSGPGPPTGRRRGRPGWSTRPGRIPAPGSLNSWHQISSPASSGQQVAVLLLGGAGEQEGGSGPSDPDGVGRSLHLGPAELVVHDQLVGGVGADPPRRGPVRSDQAALGQSAGARRLRVVPRNQPAGTEAHGRGSSSVRQREVHGRASVGCPAGTRQDEERPLSTWNFGDVWEAVADELPDAPALTHGTTHPDLG